MVSTTLPLRSTSNRVISFLQFVYYILEGAILFFIPQSWRPKKGISGQTVLITGGGSGIGRLLAVEFASLNCIVVLWDVNLSGMEETVRLIEDSNNRVFCYQVNLENLDQIKQTAEKVKQEIGTVDILINNAGIVNGKYLLDLSDESIRRTFEVNTLAHYHMIRQFLPAMIAQKRGHIVTVSSALGNLVGCKISDYCGSKFATVGLDLALRVELAQAGLSSVIRTTVVKAYLTSTGLFEGANSLPLFPPLSPDYVARAIVTGVLSDAIEVILPYRIVYFFYLISMLPSKAIIPLADFAGVFNVLDRFGLSGRNGECKDFSSVKVELNNNKV